MILGGIIGGVIGFVLGAAGVAPEIIQPVIVLVSFICGLAISIVPLKLILGKDFGEFRLVLLAQSDACQS